MLRMCWKLARWDCIKTQLGSRAGLSPLSSGNKPGFQSLVWNTARLGSFPLFVTMDWSSTCHVRMSMPKVAMNLRVLAGKYRKPHFYMVLASCDFSSSFMKNLASSVDLLELSCACLLDGFCLVGWDILNPSRLRSFGCNQSENSAWPKNTWYWAHSGKYFGMVTSSTYITAVRWCEGFV